MKSIITLITMSVVTLACAIAVAATTTYSQKFTTTHPAKATGITLKWSTGAQPKTVTLTFPSGMEWIPPAKDHTKIGTGTASFKGMPSRSITVYSAHNPMTGMTLVISNPVGVSYSLNASFAHMGAQMVISIPAFRIPPSTLTGISLTVKGSTQHPFVRTPRTCPSSKVWKFSATFAYPSGTRQTLNSTSACVRH
jgi:hypothetical protein